MKADRPFDSLVESIGEKINVSLKDGSDYHGILVSFDIHLNIVLEKVAGREGKMIIRGDMISTITNLK